MVLSAITGFTSADLDALPDIPGIRYEIIDGELLVAKQPNFWHQFATSQLSYTFLEWDRTNERGWATHEPGLVLSDDNDVIPDLVWVSRARLRSILDEKGHLREAPELAVEVLSPGRANEFRDRELKLSLYSRQGVQEYWIIDPQRRTVDVYRRTGTELELATTLSGEDALTSSLLPGFACAISRLWGPTIDEG